MNRVLDVRGRLLLCMHMHVWTLSVRGKIMLGSNLFLSYRTTVGQWIKALFILITVDMLFYLLVYASDQLISPISRRMANLSFVLWQVQLSYVVYSLIVLLDINCFTALVCLFRLTINPQLGPLENYSWMGEGEVVKKI